MFWNVFVDEDILEAFQAELETIFSDALAKKHRSKRLRIPIELCRLFYALCFNATSSDIEDLIYFLLDAVQASGAVLDFSELDLDSVRLSTCSLLCKFLTFL